MNKSEEMLTLPRWMWEAAQMLLKAATRVIEMSRVAWQAEEKPRLAAEGVSQVDLVVDCIERIHDFELRLDRLQEPDELVWRQTLHELQAAANDAQSRLKVLEATDPGRKIGPARLATIEDLDRAIEEHRQLGHHPAEDEYPDT